jgi:hypothetical protein
VKERAKRFVACADEVFRLHKRQGVECDFFRGFCDLGHYAGRGAHSTRQGIYCVAPSGRLLASVNTTDPKRMAAMLDTALEKWRTLKKGERYLDPAPTRAGFLARRGEGKYPKDGLVLRSFVRDLPGKGATVAKDWRGRAWNTDLAWFRKEEARRLVPTAPKKGEVYDVPPQVLGRLVRYTFVDSVRGQTLPFADGEVTRATLPATVVSVKDGRVELRFKGSSRAEAKGTWSVGGLRNPQRSPQERGVELEVGGRAVYDVKAEGFVEFRIVAQGTRWGGTRFNFRQDDLGRAPIGFVVDLASDKPADTVAPAFWYRYFR